jgi:hypothetical protein
MQGTITIERQGWWLCEEDSAGTMYFVHHTSIPAGINLHTNDRIEFDVAPNPLKPGYVMAVNVVRIYRAPLGPRLRPQVKS